ncbi:hypothetical protein KsCSTR_32480 [Candidatus Kuenenia stuttgartiensis]|uniref:Uncharacterized protein n=1 Tax=Kuenenia stuttgartiensis TaxID=174633 RepID=Q1Q4P6_KUEST|nr:hypothetical protein KsCSTR_32480 [Candidatus Kuenenia stuttgartiensis]CAJ74979.1 unknown protein [Candidatus Kuenenia stuttgartiensis]
MQFAFFILHFHCFCFNIATKKRGEHHPLPVVLPHNDKQKRLFAITIGTGTLSF